jgi:CheY-like chemotaxis protein
METRAMATKTVLVVDDEKLIRWSLCEALRKDYTVYTAASAEEAVNLLGRMNVDVVITDLKMPGMNGLDFIDLLHQKRPGVKVFAISAYANEILVKQLLSRGVVEVFSKPFEMKHVLESLEHSGLEPRRATG